jgi:hypothetical protein
MEKAAGLFAVGLLCLLGGYLWNGLFPINKPLWTSSYVLFTGGLGLMILALCYWLIDLLGIERWSRPFTVFGVNALALFALSASSPTSSARFTSPPPTAPRSPCASSSTRNSSPAGSRRSTPHSPSPSRMLLSGGALCICSTAGASLSGLRA